MSIVLVGLCSIADYSDKKEELCVNAPKARAQSDRTKSEWNGILPNDGFSTAQMVSSTYT